MRWEFVEHMEMGKWRLGKLRESSYMLPMNVVPSLPLGDITPFSKKFALDFKV